MSKIGDRHSPPVGLIQARLSPRTVAAIGTTNADPRSFEAEATRALGGGDLDHKVP